MRVLIGYERSGVVREAFRARGHDAVSCDLEPAEDGSPHHILADVRAALDRDAWDLAIFHPPCTYLTVSAAWAFADPDFDRYPGVGYHQRVKPGTLTGAARREARERALAEVGFLMQCGIPHCIENPARSFIAAAFRSPDQVVQPYEFGHDASKATGLWLSGLPPLETLDEQRGIGRRVEWPPGSGRFVERWDNQTDSGQNRLTPSPERMMDRARTYPGIAAAMADQWGQPVLQSALL